jgi:hypothetical protein
MRSSGRRFEGHVASIEARKKGSLFTEPHKLVVATCSTLPQAAEASSARIVLICHGTGGSSVCGLVPIRVADAVTFRQPEHSDRHCCAQTGALRAAMNYGHRGRRGVAARWDAKANEKLSARALAAVCVSSSTARAR